MAQAQVSADKLYISYTGCQDIQDKCKYISINFPKLKIRPSNIEILLQPLKNILVLQLKGHTRQCDILSKSIPRFEGRIFPGEDLNKGRQLLNLNSDSLKYSHTYRGVLAELDVEFLYDGVFVCEKYPYMNMDETCKYIIWMLFYLCFIFEIFVNSF